MGCEVFIGNGDTCSRCNRGMNCHTCREDELEGYKRTMKASDLIRDLQRGIEEYGDREVACHHIDADIGKAVYTQAVQCGEIVFLLD